jgi:cytochrome c biogenesis protein ResB
MRRLVDIISSRPLLILLALLVAGISLLGAIVPQNLPRYYYEAHYQAWMFNVLKTLDITDIYRSWYFVALLLFLAAMVFACTARRLPKILAALRREPPIPVFEEVSFTRADVGPAPSFGEISAALKRLPVRWRVADGVLYGRKCPFGLLGNVLVHVSFLVILIGALLKVFGHSEELSVFEGQGVVLPPAFGEGFELRADAVDEIADANTGKVSDYRTKVRLLRYGDVVAAKELDVDGPLHYRGLGIYQSKVEAAGAKGLFVEVIKLKDGAQGRGYGRATFTWTVGPENGDVTIAPGEREALGRTGLELRYVDYFERFAATETHVGDDGAAYNPAAFIRLVNAEGAAAVGVLFKLHPEQSFIRADGPGFTDKPVRITYGADNGPWRAARREYLLASGSYIMIGEVGETMQVTTAAGENRDLRQRSLGGVLQKRDGGERRFDFPFAARVGVKTDDGHYLFRFLGSKTGPVAGLTVARDPGLGFFYAGCLLFSIGIVAAMLWRYDELAAYVRDGRVYIAARSNKGARVLKPAFDGWLSEIREDF